MENVDTTRTAKNLPKLGVFVTMDLKMIQMTILTMTVSESTLAIERTLLSIMIVGPLVTPNVLTLMTLASVPVAMVTKPM